MRRCADILQKKTKEYTGDDTDRLGAFKAAATLQHATPQRALAGMMAKHIISIYDMCFTDRKTFELFRCEAPELLHLPEATFDWYCRNYLDRDYPLRMILRLNGVEFPERLG